MVTFIYNPLAVQADDGSNLVMAAQPNDLNHSAHGLYVGELKGLLPPPRNMYRKRMKYNSSPPFPRNFRSSNYFTIAPEVVVAGPGLYFDDGKPLRETLSNQSVYFQSIFRAIINSAHKYAQGEYTPGANDNFTYYSFLVAALAVPLHESRLQHFRVSNSNKCYSNTNNLSVYYDSVTYKKATGRNTLFLRNTLRATGDIIREAYKDPVEVYFPSCEQLPKDTLMHQVLTSTNLMDFGIMQINIKSHASDFLRPDTALSLYETIDNGVQYLWDQKGARGFIYLRNKLNYVNRYSKACEFKINPFYTLNKSNEEVPYSGTRSAIYYNLIRASWAGFYNQGAGQPKNVCRFSNVKARNHNNDIEFKRSLDSIVKFDKSPWHKFLPKNSVEYAALTEIVYNFRTIYTKKIEEEKSEYVKLIVNAPLKAFGTKAELNYSDYNVNYLFNQDKIEVYKIPQLRGHDGSTNKCGFIKNPIKRGYFKTHVISEFEDKDQMKWALIKMPKYAEYYFKDAPVYVKKKKSKSKINANIRLTKAGKLSGLVFDAKMAKDYPRLPLLQQDGNWYEVSIDGAPYWIHRVNFETFQDDSNVDPLCQVDQFFVNSSVLEKVNKAPIGYATLKVKNIKIRKYPDSKATVIDMLFYSDKKPVGVPILAETTNRRGKKWMSVKPNGFVRGWVRANQFNVHYFDKNKINSPVGEEG